MLTTRPRGQVVRGSKKTHKKKRLSHFRISNQGNCVHRLILSELHLSVFGSEAIGSDRRSIGISDTL